MRQSSTKSRKPRASPLETQAKVPLRFSIGGVGLSLQWQEPRKVGWPHPFYEPFIGEEDETIDLQVHFDKPEEFAGERLIFDGEHQWRLYRQDSRYLFEGFEPFTKTRNMISFLEDNLQRARVYVFPVPSQETLPAEDIVPAWSLHRLMNPLGQWLLAHRLVELGGIMVHALAVDDRGRGRVFVGPSGSGKSTLAKFWRRRKGARILCDEHVILRRQGGHFFVYGTPWPGEGFTVSAGPVELKQIFFIEHHPEHRAWDESKGLFASRLFSQVFLPRWSHRIVESGLTVCEELVQTVECKRLGFAKHPSVIDFVRQI